MPCYADSAPDYLAHDIPPFPVAPDGKKPLVKGWQTASAEAARRWMGKFADANLGITCGPRSGVTEVDVDAPGENAIADAISRFGETSVVIRTASGKWKLWYAHNGERRLIRPVNDLAVDVLGGGFTIAPPSVRTDVGGQYEFIQGGLDDLDRLPAIQLGAIPESTPANAPRTDGLVPVGERDEWLFKRLLREAHHVDDFDALQDVAHSLNSDALAEPLPSEQVDAKTRRAWGLQSEGRNFVSRPSVVMPNDVLDALLDVPYALILLQVLHRNHGHGGRFALSPRAMAGTTLPYNWKTIRQARDVLLERGYLVQVHEGSGRGDPPLYRLT